MYRHFWFRDQGIGESGNQGTYGSPEPPPFSLKLETTQKNFFAGLRPASLTKSKRITCMTMSEEIKQGYFDVFY
jgi:hypothetical protein